MKDINNLNYVCAKALGLIVLILGLASCSLDENTYSKVWGIQEPEIVSHLDEKHRGLTEYNQNPNLNMNINDRILFSHKDRVSFLIESNCYVSSETFNERWSGQLPKEMKLLEIIPKDLIFQKNLSLKTKCSFAFILKNERGDQHTFLLGSNSISLNKTVFPEKIKISSQKDIRILHSDFNETLGLFFEESSGENWISCEDLSLLIDSKKNISLFERVKEKYTDMEFRKIYPEQSCRLMILEEDRIKNITPSFIIKFPWIKSADPNFVKKPKHL